MQQNKHYGIVFPHYKNDTQPTQREANIMSDSRNDSMLALSPDTNTIANTEEELASLPAWPSLSPAPQLEPLRNTAASPVDDANHTNEQQWPASPLVMDAPPVLNFTPEEQEAFLQLLSNISGLDVSAEEE